MKRSIGHLVPLALSALAGCGVIFSQAEAQGRASLLTTGLGKDFASDTANANGTTLRYVRGEKGPPLIHGFPQDWFEYQAIMPRLAKRFTVVAVDLRGIGGSTATA